MSILSRILTPHQQIANEERPSSAVVFQRADKEHQGGAKEEKRVLSRLYPSFSFPILPRSGHNDLISSVIFIYHTDYFAYTPQLLWAEALPGIKTLTAPPGGCPIEPESTL